MSPMPLRPRMRDLALTPFGAVAQRVRAGFTLLEVMVALGILSLSLIVMLETQASSVVLTAEARKISVATQLADEKLMEVMLTLEREGWTSQDIEEEGHFDDFGSEEFRGESLNLDLEDEYKDFHFAYTVRRIEMTLPGDVMGTAGELAQGGYWGEQSDEAQEQQASQSAGFDLSDIPGFNPEQITEYLSNYIREVRVVVWWGENEDETDQVEITTHAINPSGIVATPDQPQ